MAPTWDDISKLAVIATIRTMLNYFLAKDIMAFDKSQEAGSEGGPNPEIKALLISWTLRRICGSVPDVNVRAQGPKMLELRQVARVSGVQSQGWRSFFRRNGRLDRGG